MIGDQNDMQARLKAVLPARWFSDQTPVLDAVLGGLAAGWSWSYDLLQNLKSQTRIATASGIWLDVIAQDFFGSRVSRRGTQDDDAFRLRIRQELFRERGTRAAVISILKDLTGRAPIIFEPTRPADTGAYGSRSNPGTGLAYGAAGGWGSLVLPFQSFIKAYRPVGNGIAVVNGWGGGAGGYGTGSIEYASLDMVQGQVTDNEIYTSIASVLPTSTIAWTQISN